MRSLLTSGRLTLLCAMSLAGSLAVAITMPVSVDGQRRAPSLAPVPDERPPAPENTTQCNYQEPFDYLIRGNFLPRWSQPPEEQRRRAELSKQAIRFRTENYGYFEGFGQPSWNEHPPSHYAKRVRFMDLSITVNERIVPALECVEQQIRAECGNAYVPRRLSGLRPTNTYHNGEVSNHVYGIAVDVDPTLNTCCRCVAQWQDHPLCQRDVESIYERMAMPACWVHVFERFGFYWLGRDQLQDTMHFEFLGDPSHVLKSSGPPPHMSSASTPSVAPAPTDMEPAGMEPSSGPPPTMEPAGMSPAAMTPAGMTTALIDELADPLASGSGSSGGCGCHAAGA